MPYAANTNVSSGRTRAEIEHLLSAQGATQFAYATFTNGEDEDEE